MANWMRSFYFDSDVNQSLGSWGQQPADEDPGAAVVPTSDLLTAADWLEMAQRWDGFCLDAIREGREDDAADCAVAVVRFCREHQLAGGQPWDGGE